MDSVGRYSYFGSFRSGVSNVGPDAAIAGAREVAIFPPVTGG